MPILVPAKIPLIMVVSRVGHEDWHYTEPDGAEKQILIGSGEEMALVIRMRPNH